MLSDMDVIRSRSAEKIRAYCHTLAQELGLTLECQPCWTYLDLPDMEQPPYSLTLSVTAPFKATPEFWFTRAQVLGYATGKTKAAIQSKMRQDLETHRGYDV
jgi:hypothetical protein